MITFSGYRPIHSARPARFQGSVPGPDEQFARERAEAIERIEAQLRSEGHPPLDQLRQAETLLRERFHADGKLDGIRSNPQGFDISAVVPHMQGYNILLQSAFDPTAAPHFDYLQELPHIDNLKKRSGGQVSFDYAPPELQPYRFRVLASQTFPLKR
jgi:hypothetical protein